MRKEKKNLQLKKEKIENSDNRAILLFLFILLLLILIIAFEGLFNKNASYDENLGSSGIFEEIAAIQSSPIGNYVSMTPEGKQSFSVEEDYEEIKWYLDEKEIYANVKQIEIKKLSIGSHSLRVDAKTGQEINSKIWSILVEKDEESPFSPGNLIFYMIIIVIIMIMILIGWLIVAEGKKRKIKSEYGFGVSGVKIRGKTEKNDFNIPE